MNTGVALDTPSGTVTNTLLPTLSVFNLGGLPQGQLPYTSDPTGNAPGGLVIGTPDAEVVDSNVNQNGLAANSPGGILTGYYRPGAQDLSDPSQNVNDLIDGFYSTGQLYSNPLYGSPLSDYSASAGSFTDIDPLVLDLTGAGISLSSWIDNNIYFQSNVTFNPTTGQAVSDGETHHTSWVNASNGILVLPVNGQVSNITETLSEYFEGGQYNAATGTYTPWTDGLAALASLATAGATVFSAATSKIDPATGQSYWSELRIWQDTNQDGVAQAGELETLASLGITSIGLVGTGNQGEQINGSAVVNNSTYTTSSGTTGEVASVDLQTDTTGDVTTNASGGVEITSTPEGGASPSTSFVAKNATAHSYILNHGTLTDQTTGTVVGTGITGVFSTTQGDTITVAAGDTTSYWLGGGSGADTLTGGAGTNLFLVNAQTTVHGGSGFNIAQVDDSQPVNIDLMKDNLQEVIGGAGGGVFNASGTTWNVFIQGGTGNNIIIGGAAHDALSGGTGDDLIEAGSGGSVIHAGSGSDVIYGGSGSTGGKPNSDIIYAGPGNDIVTLGTNNSEVYDGTGTLTVIGNPNGFSVVGFHGSYADYTLTHNADGSITVTNINDEDGDGTVTMKNVTDLDFKDISQVPVAQTAGMPVNDELETSDPDQVTINSSGQYVIAASTLLANDIDYAGDPLTISNLLSSPTTSNPSGTAIDPGQSGTVNGGTAALSANGQTITFTPAAGFTGVMSFQYQLTGGAAVQQLGTSNTAEMSATVYLNTPTDPTDPLFDSEWFLQAAYIIPVWQYYTGAGVSVGVFDPSGNVDFSNPDLAANAGTSITVSGTLGVTQLGTHATLVAGIIGAAPDGEGGVGVAYGATIDSVALPQTTLSNLNNLSDWANYDIVNNSWVISPPFADSFLLSPGYQAAFQDAAAYGRNGLGTIMVFAGGNQRAAGGNTNDLNETNSIYGITVGGIDATADLGTLIPASAPFSNPGYSILVSAPANNITSDGISYANEFGQVFGADTQTAEGTSFATPIVSGVVALMLQANPNLGYRDVQEILALTATKVNDPTTTWMTNAAANWNGGGMHYSADYGYGEVNALAAVGLAQTWQAQQTYANELASSLTQSGSPGDLVTGFAYSSGGLTLQSGDRSTPVLTSSGTETLYGYSNVRAAVAPAGLTIEDVVVTLDLNITDLPLQDAEIILTPYTLTPDNLGGTIVNQYIPLGWPTTVESSNLLDDEGQTPSSGVITTESDGDQHLQFQLTSVAYMGMTPSSNIVWAVRAVNTTTGQDIDNAINWQIQFYGSPSSAPQQWVFTDEYGGGASITPVTSTDSFNASATTGNGNIIDLRSGTSDSKLDGHSVAVQGNLGKGFGGFGNGTTLIANSAGDLLFGGYGNDDVVQGGTGNDTLDAGIGSGDTLVGGGGNDTYDFNANYGPDTIVNGAATNSGPTGTLLLGAGMIKTSTTVLSPDDLWFAKVGNDLVIQVLSTTNQVTVQGWFANSYSQLQSLVLPDGSQIGTAAINALANAMASYQASNPSFNAQTAAALPNAATLNAALDQYWARTITATTSSDVLNDGGIGNNTLIGNGATYDYGSGYGQDLIVNGISSNATPSGTLQLGAGLTPNNLWFSQSGNNLLIQVIGTTSQVTIQGWFAGTWSQVAALQLSDGSQITPGEINTLKAAMAAYSASNLSFNVQTASSLPSSATLDAALEQGWARTITGTNGNEVFDDTVGNNTLIGGGGDDTYVFGVGSGQDIVIVNGVATNAGPTGTLQFGAGLTPNNLWFSRSGANLVIQVIGAASHVTVQGWFANTWSQLAALQLADGSQITTAQINALANAMSAYSAANPAFNPAAAGAVMPPVDWSAPPPALDWVAAAGGWARTINAASTGGTINPAFGEDTVLFGRGDGAVTVTSWPQAGGTLSVLMQSGITAANLWLSFDAAGDLTIQILGTTDRLVLRNWQSTVPQYDSFNQATTGTIAFSNGSHLSIGAIWSLTGAMAQYAKNNASFNPTASTNTTITALPGANSALTASGPTLISALTSNVASHLITTSAGQTITDGNNPNDILDGAGGNATLISTYDLWNDMTTFVFGRGYGHETVTGAGVLQLTGRVTEDQVWFQWTSAAKTSMVITLLGSGGADTVTITNWQQFTSMPNVFQSGLALPDGSMISAAQMQAMADWMTAYAQAHEFNPAQQTSATAATGFQLLADTGNGSGLTAGVGEGTWSRIIGEGSVAPGLSFSAQEGSNTLVAEGSDDTFTFGGGNGTIAAGAGSYTLMGSTGNDTFLPGVGNDTLVGGGGSDIYNFAAGAGQDVIVNGVSSGAGSSSGPSGELEIAAELALNQLWFTQSGNDLLIQVLGTTSAVTVQDWFADTDRQLQSVTLANGTSLSTSELTALAVTEASYQSTTTGFSVQTSHPDFMISVGSVLSAGTVTGAVLIGFGTATLEATGGSDWLALLDNKETAVAGSGAHIFVGGAGEIVQAPSASVVGLANSSFTITGTRDLLSLNSGVVATVSGSGDTVNVTGTNVVLTASSETIAVAAAAALTLTGSNNIINLGSAAAVTLAGGNATTTINGYGNDTITAGSGTTVINTGNGNSSVLLTGRTGTVTVSGDNNAIAVNGAGYTLTASGTGDTIAAVAGDLIAESAANAAITVNGSSVTSTVAAGDTITAAGSADIINFTNGGTFDQGGTASSATLTGSNVVARVSPNSGTVIAHGNGNVLNLGSNGAVTVNSNNDTSATAGTNDFLFSDANTGLVLNLQQQNGNVESATGIGIASAGWEVVGTGDFMGNGGNDILFENTNSGLVLYWEMQNGTAEKGVSLDVANSPWTLVGTGDFTGNGTDDILFLNGTNGELLYWELQNGTVAAGVELGVVGTGWKFLGTGDFTGSRTDDVLFQNTSTDMLYWQVQGGTVAAGVSLGVANSDWKYVGVGDFYGNGTDDILFQNINTNQVLYWEMSNGSLVQGNMLGTAPSGYNVVGTGKYGGGTTSDVLLSNASTGSYLEWQISNGAISQTIAVGNATSDWKLA